MSSLSSQQRAVLAALLDKSPLPTTVLRDVRADYSVPAGTQSCRIGEPVGAVLRRLEKRGLVVSARGRDCKDWWISDLGIRAMGFTRGIR
jgi:DNA-binding MarR family transcriptional regulator